MMKHLVLLLGALLLVACGGQAPPPATPARAPESAAVPKALGKPRMTVEYVVVHTKWVEKTMTPSPNDVSAWYETADGKAVVAPQRRDLIFTTKKKAEAALARVKKGELPETEVIGLGTNPTIDAAYEKLAIGDAVLVELGPKSFQILKKDRPTDEAIEKAYKKAKAAELAQKLAASLLARLQKAEADARSTIAEVVEEILGERAVADPDRPVPVVVDDDRISHARLQPKAKDAVSEMLKSAKAGETVKEPILEGDSTTIARAVPPPGP
jgi:hypothetical protein